MGLHDVGCDSSQWSAVHRYVASPTICPPHPLPVCPPPQVRVFPLHPEGVVTVRFKQAEPAEACVALMNGRFFGGNKLVAHMWDGFTQYHGVRLL